MLWVWHECFTPTSGLHPSTFSALEILGLLLWGSSWGGGFREILARLPRIGTGKTKSLLNQKENYSCHHGSLVPRSHPKIGKAVFSLGLFGVVRTTWFVWCTTWLAPENPFAPLPLPSNYDIHTWPSHTVHLQGLPRALHHLVCNFWENTVGKGVWLHFLVSAESAYYVTVVITW